MLVMDNPNETTADRLVATLEMYEFGVELKAGQLRRKYPEASPKRIEQLVDAWLAESSEIQAGSPSR